MAGLLEHKELLGGAYRQASNAPQSPLRLTRSLAAAKIHPMVRAPEPPPQSADPLPDAFFRDIIDGLPVAVFVTDRSGAPVYTNQAAIELLGKSADPAVGPETIAAVYDAVLQDSELPYPAERMPVVRALAGEASTVGDMALRRPAGTLDIEVWGKPIVDAAGEVAHAAACFVDISERRRLTRRNRELAEALDSARQELASVTGFIAMCASCKAVRTRAGDWMPVEELIDRTVRLTVSHGLCPRCLPKYGGGGGDA